MSFFKTTTLGKCDVSYELYKDEELLHRHSSTYDCKPTLKGLKSELKELFPQANVLVVFTTPAWKTKTIKI